MARAYDGGHRRPRDRRPPDDPRSRREPGGAARPRRLGALADGLAYEKDRLDPLDPAARLTLDGDLLARFPAGYRHPAYAHTRIGFDVKRDMPGLTGPEVEALYARGARWLGGEPPDYSPATW